MHDERHLAMTRWRFLSPGGRGEGTDVDVRFAFTRWLKSAKKIRLFCR